MSLLPWRKDVAPVSGAGLPYPAGSWEYLAALWVRWAGSIPGSRHPIADTTGERAATGQPPQVWFLAGTFGGPEITRSVSVPAAKPVFFPAFCFWGPPEQVIPLRGAWGQVTLDGVVQPLLDVTTPGEFRARNAWRGPLGLAPLTFDLAVTGLWCRLDQGLEAGEHELLLRGGDGDSFEVAVRYHLLAV